MTDDISPESSFWSWTCPNRGVHSCLNPAQDPVRRSSPSCSRDLPLREDARHAARHPRPRTPAAQPSTREARRAGISAFIGTTIEWFDFYIYGSAAALVLGKVFFTDASPAVGTLAAFATFWIGFLARPLGGLIFGHFGDRRGRKAALVVTLIMMGAPPSASGCSPDTRRSASPPRSCWCCCG